MSNQAIFQSGILIAKQTIDAFGNTVANPTPVQFATLQSANVDIQFDTKQLYGSDGQFAKFTAKGKGKVEAKFTLGVMNSQIFNTVFGQGINSGEHKVSYNMDGGAIPSTPTITITPPNNGVFDKDQGVTFRVTGQVLTRVASTTPATNQYHVDESTGVYTFATADVAKTIYINYSYNTTSNGASGKLENIPMGFSPSFSAELMVQFQGKTFCLTLFNCTPTRMSFDTKLDDFTVPEIDVICSADENGDVLGWSLAN